MKRTYLRILTMMVVFIVMIGEAVVVVAAASSSSTASEPRSSSSAWIYGITSWLIICVISCALLAFVNYHRNAIGVKTRVFIIGLGSGLMIGTAFLTLLPETGEDIEGRLVGSLVIAGIIGGIALEIVCRREHVMDDIIAEAEPDVSSAASRSPTVKAQITRSSSIDEIWIIEHDMQSVDKAKSDRFMVENALSVSVAVAGCAHAAFNGFVIGVMFQSNREQGIIVASAVAVHTIPRVIADFFILIAAGWTCRKSNFAILLSLVAMAIGNVAGLVLGAVFEGSVIYCLPVAAGQFLYLSLAHIIPDLFSMKSHTNRNIGLIGVIIGIVIVAVLLFMPEGAHDFGDSSLPVKQ